MSQYDIFVSYSTCDEKIAKSIIDKLENRKIIVANRFGEQANGLLGLMLDKLSNVDELINYSEFFVVLAGDNLTGQKDGGYGQLRQMHIAAMRKKKVIYIDLTSCKKMVLKNISAKDVVSRISLNLNQKNYADETAEKVCRVVNQEEEKKELYEKLSAFAKMGIADKEAELICNLIDSICERVEGERAKERKQEQFDELGRCLVKLSGKGAAVSEKTREKVAVSLGKVKTLIGKEIEETEKKDSKTASGVMKSIFTATGGGTGALTGAALLGPVGFVTGAFLGAKLGKTMAGKIEREADAQSVNCEEHNKKEIHEKEVKAEVGNNELFRSVANFMNEGNKILQLIGENEEAEDFLRCLLVSYQRLQKYCEIVGEEEIFGECVDRISELKKRLKGFNGKKTTESGIAEIGIKSLLGFETTETENYDVFICHKSEDADIATGVYDFLHQNMLEPFFDKKTLTELAESEYRKAIMKALDKSTHFIVILSNLSYMETKWVSQEMETFMHEKTEGRKDGNFIMLVTDDVYDEITKANKSNIPIEYRSCEIMKVREYEDRLLGYVRK